MFNFWGTAAAAMSAKLERLRDAERALLDFAVRHLSDDDHSRPIIQSIDTPIPVRTIHAGKDSEPHIPCLVGSTVQKDGQHCYVMHSISVQSSSPPPVSNSADSTAPPLVLLHGYMNGGAYFYRNFAGLSRHFSQIYAIDQLGWGLSSRPRFSQYFRTQYNYYSSRLLGTSNEKANGTSPERDSSVFVNDAIEYSKETSHMVHTAESFFVESLEVWRKIMGIESMVLAGHSMGGLLAVAYAERYPQHVHHLVLISPVGVPEETPAMIAARAARTTWRLRLFETLFPYVSPGDLLRWLPESMGRNWIREYVTRRLPAISDPNEQEALTEYLYSNNGVLPGSGEYCLPKLLKPSVFGRKPLQYRIPKLQVASCSFLYGDSDWMDSNGGLYVEHACAKIKKDGVSAPSVDVYQVSQAGHLLMLENNVEFNNGLVWAVFSNETRSAFDIFKDDAPLPAKLLVNGQSLHSQEQPSKGESNHVPPMLDSPAT